MSFPLGVGHGTNVLIKDLDDGTQIRLVIKAKFAFLKHGDRILTTKDMEHSTVTNTIAYFNSHWRRFYD